MNSLFKTVTCANDSDVIAYPQPDIITTQQIFIDDLELEMFIGVLDHEKNAKQRVIVNLIIDVAPTQNWQDDNINDVVSYADIIDMIREISNSDQHIELVETFAHMIADNCLKHPEIMCADIRVSKPDIMDKTSSVGVRLKKAAKNY